MNLFLKYLFGYLLVDKAFKKKEELENDKDFSLLFSEKEKFEVVSNILSNEEKEDLIENYGNNKNLWEEILESKEGQILIYERRKQEERERSNAPFSLGAKIVFWVGVFLCLLVMYLLEKN